MGKRDSVIFIVTASKKLEEKNELLKNTREFHRC